MAADLLTQLAADVALEAAMSAWQETATAMGLLLDDEDASLMGELRKTALVSAAAYAERLARKGSSRRWPALREMSA